MKRLYLLGLLILCTVMTVRATTYCHYPLSSNDGNSTITLTCEKVSDGNYRMTIEGENLNGLGGTFYKPGDVDVRSKITSSTSTKIVINIDAASDPKFYTPLYVLMPGEVTFGELNGKDIVWGTCDVSGGESGGGESGGGESGGGETGTADPATYCRTDMTFGTNTIMLSTIKVSEGNYRLVIEGENLTGLGGTYYTPGNVHLGGKITTQTSTKIICDITAPSAPKFYTPLYVMTSGGQLTFSDVNGKDIVWGICDDPCLEGNGVDWAAGALCSAGFFEGSSAQVPVTTYVPDKAVDGDTNTRWGSYGSGEAPDWWQVDLEEIRMLDSIRIMFSTCDIVGYAVKGSTDANSWFTLLEVNDAPLIDRYINHPLPENSMARYLRVEPIGGTFMSFWEFNAFGTCERISSKPVMVSAVVDEESIGETSVKVQVGAIDKETSFPNIKYNVVITTGSSVGSKTTLTATDGILTISGLVGYTDYSVEIWAVDGDSNESENSKVVEFTTAPYTGLYLREWNGGNGNSIRFRKTAVSGVYVGQLALPAGTFTYYLEDKNTGKTTSTNGGERPLVLKVPTMVTFYAKDVDTFASNADSIFLSGPAVGCGTSDWATCGETRLCTWDGDKAVWTGEIDPTEVYGICKIAHPSNGNTDVYPQDIMKGTENPDVTSTRGTFTFDLPTFTWSWKNAACEFYGYPGDGTDLVDSQPFNKGYKLTVQLSDDKSKLLVEAIVYDNDGTRGNCYFQHYPYLDPKAFQKDIIIPKVKGTDSVYYGEITINQLKNYEDGMIRFAVKFETPAVRITLPEYFYLDGSGCAKRLFTIYHYNDMPAVPETGAVTQYAGGKILQPIKYKRKLTPGVWETLCLPFVVDSITVYDPDDDKDYKLYAQYTSGGTVYPGEFWLRVFKEAAVTQDNFEPNWHDIEAGSQEKALPQKGVPYIIRVPEGTYYKDKYLVFHGAGYQIIDNTYTAPALPADGYFSYSGNNTMRPWNLNAAYVLDAQGEYFWADQTVTLQPFECAVNATKNTINRMPRLQMAPRQIATDHSLPSTADEQGRIYTLMGTLVGQYSSVDAKDAALQRLPEGLYILQTDRETSKIYIAK